MASTFSHINFNQTITSYLARSDSPLLQDPPYSPDLAPSDYWFYNKLKLDIKGKVFNSAEEVKAVVIGSINSITADQYAHAYEDWPKRWKACIDVNGGYLRMPMNLE